MYMNTRKVEGWTPGKVENETILLISLPVALYFLLISNFLSWQTSSWGQIGHKSCAKFGSISADITSHKHSEQYLKIASEFR